MDQNQRSPLDYLGDMPAAPRGWETMPVVQPGHELQPGERLPLTSYKVVEVVDLNILLGW